METITESTVASMTIDVLPELLTATMDDTQRAECIVDKTILEGTYPAGYGLTSEGFFVVRNYKTGEPQVKPIDHLLGLASSRDVARITIHKVCSPKLHFVNGDRIHSVFEHYRPGSCMRYPNCSDLREMYVQNPDDVSCVYWVKEENGLICSHGSALLWHGKKRVYLDRVYCGGYLSFPCWIDSLCTTISAEYGKPVATLYNAGNDTPIHDKTVTFKLKIPSTGHAPYCDTLTVIRKTDTRNNLFWLSSDGTGQTCNNTDGTSIDGSEREGTYRCCNCGDRVSEDDVYTPDGGDGTYCQSCYGDNFSLCQWFEEDYSADEVSEHEVYCYGPSRYATRSNRGTAQWHSMFISDQALSDDFTELSDGRYVHSSLIVEDVNGDYHDPEGDTFTITENGDIYPVDEVCQLVNGECHPIDDCVEVDGEWYLDGSQPEVEPEVESTTINKENDNVNA
jgi:hypothetical protein